MHVLANGCDLPGVVEYPHTRAKSYPFDRRYTDVDESNVLDLPMH